jgi:phosphoglycolate phosphatase-like HAD superfamily hydrolase
VLTWAAMKILSDFDGVWTDQALEAEQVKLFLAAEAARLAGVSADAALEHFREYEMQVRSSPERYGWAPDGRITAYVDEDPFCVPNSIAVYVEEGAEEHTRAYREAILDGGYANLTAFADHCFHTAASEYRQQHPPGLVAGAAEVLHELHGLGAEVLVVSNSPAEKIIGWFTAVGADAGTSREHDLRVRGQAGKQTLGPTDEAIEVAGRRIFVDRPRYAEVIEEEDPDLIIGDVFSLDLALPHVLRSRGNPKAPRTLVLRRHDHTPAWIVETRAEGAIDKVVESVHDLIELVR